VSPPVSRSRSLAPLYWSLAGSTVLAALIVVATFWLGSRAATEEEWVVHTLTAREQLARILALVQRAESAQRGYLLTGQEEYLAPFDASADPLPAALDALQKLVSDNPRQEPSVAALRQAIPQKLAELRATIDARKLGRSEAALAIVNTDESQQAMDRIARTLAAMDAEENRLLTERKAKAATFNALVQGGVGAAFLLICGIGALVAYLARATFSELAGARDRLAAVNNDLMDQIGRREEVESQLRQAQKMEAVGQLTGGIAHDFNNMLGVIVSALDLMETRLKRGDHGIERFIDAATKAAERAVTLTHRLLAFARQQPLAPRPIDANQMIASMSDLLRSTLGEHIRIEAVSAAGLWRTNADAHQLEGAILNVAINARDAMPDGGKLTIETGNAFLDEDYCRQNGEVAPGQYVMIAVTDTGAGMPADVAARAFDPFFTTKPAGRGTGLGLSQVYGFIKQSRGHIKIYSEIGAGTTVKIYLPRLISAAEGAAQPTVPTPEIVPKGAASEVVLVVEDDPLMRETTADALRDLGYTVVDCGSAADALRRLAGEPAASLLLTDIVMPEMNGKQLADEAVKLRSALKVLFMTGYTRNAVVHGGVLDPGVNFLSKPFTVAQLGAKVRSVLAAAAPSASEP